MTWHRPADAGQRHRPDPTRSARRAAGAPAMPRRGRPRAHAARARGRDRARAPGSAGSPTTSRTPSRSRSPTCPAGPPRPRPATPAGCCSGGWTAGRSSCSRAGSTCTRATTRASSSSRSCCSSRLGARIVVLTNAAGGLDPSFGPGHAHGHARPPQSDRPEPAHRPQRRRARAALPGPDRCVEPAAARAPPCAAAQAEGVELEEGIYVGLTGPDLRDAGRGPDAARRSAADAVGMSTVLEVHRGTLGRASRSAASRS